jgi:thiosulfate/3-mercaptopyruvate sulfurtransferase
VDARSDLTAYLQGHIPGAVYFHYESLRGSAQGVPADMLAPEAYASLFSQLGLNLDKPVVIYGSGGPANYNATFLAWILHGFDHPSVQLLDGGYSKWAAENRAVDRNYPKVQPTKFPAARFSPRIVRLSQVRFAVEQKAGMLVDARIEEQFRGEAGPQIRRGHIPGAVSRFWQSDLAQAGGQSAWKPVEQLRREYEQQGITPDKRIIVYCNTGTEASHIYFTLYCMLKYPSVGVYVPSYTEWAEKADLPVEKGIR